MLPNNSAWATSVAYKDKKNELKPYTNCTALKNGWVWNIPSWDKIGTGYVYSDKYISDENALKEFKKYLDSKNTDYSKSKFNNIKMRVGIHERIFVKNVCAIGLSAGFIEPLESNGLLSVHEFLKHLVKILKRGVVSQWDKDNFNFTCKTFFDEFAEFVSFHYCLSSRTDSKYWKDIKNRSYFDKRKGDIMLKKNIECFMNPNTFFRSDAGTHYISTGMNYFGADVADRQVMGDIDKLKEIIEKRKRESKKWDSICKNKNSLLDFLKRYIHK